MRIVHYERKAYNEAIENLLMSRDMNVALVNDLPNIGYIALDDSSNIIAAGFLRWIEGDYGMLDSYITAPSFSSELRNEGLDLITTALIDHARSLGIHSLLVFSHQSSIVERSLRHNFIPIEHKATIKKL